MNSPKTSLIIGSLWLIVLVVRIVEGYATYPYQPNWIVIIPYVIAALLFYTLAFLQFRKTAKNNTP